jgi:hypothetical protein
VMWVSHSKSRSQHWSITLKEQCVFSRRSLFFLRGRQDDSGNSDGPRNRGCVEERRSSDWDSTPWGRVELPCQLQMEDTLLPHMSHCCGFRVFVSFCDTLSLQFQNLACRIRNT